METARDVKVRINAKFLRNKFGLHAAHCLYRVDGTWYHLLKQFPGILLDRDGFLSFSSHKELANCPDIKVYAEKDQLAVRKGISEIPGYVRFDSLIPDKSGNTMGSW